MEWFTGNIAEAIQSSKRKGSVFVVYVTGNDDMTKEMDKCWDDAEVSELCRKESVVALKIKHDSEACTFFSQIYPVVVVPASFFIGNNGVPLEIVGGNTDLETFRNKVKGALEMHKSSAAQTSVQPQMPPQQQPSPQAASSTEESAEPGARASGEVSAADSSEPDEKKARVDINARVEKAKEIIEQKRAEKAQKAAEEERQKEVERRKLGQDVQQLQKFQQERELQEVRDQLRKDKEEQRKARERVKEQIERDRAERQARFHKEKAEREQQMEAAKKAKLEEQRKAAEEAEARRSEIARIQFRLPDGTSVSSQFQSTQPLQEAYNFIAQRLGESTVSLSTAYPRRTFSQEDMMSTFQDLHLAPTAVLIVVPSERFTISGQTPGGGSNLLSMLFAPLLMIWNFIMSFFSSPPAITRNSNSSAAASNSGTSAAGGDRFRPSATKRSASSSSRPDGNVRRLRNVQDDDDETATWNGNSTQQM